MSQNVIVCHIVSLYLKCYCKVDVEYLVGINGGCVCFRFFDWKNYEKIF